MATDATGTPTSPDNIARIVPSDAPAVTTLTSGVNAIADTVQTALTSNYLRKTSGNVVNADINAAAAIAYSKLNLAASVTSNDIVNGTIVDADINASAAIAYTKLALTGNIQNADINAAAAVAVSKLAAGTSSQVLTTVGSTPTWSNNNFNPSSYVTAPASANDFAIMFNLDVPFQNSITANTLYFVPCWIPDVVGTWGLIEFEVAVAGASSTVRLGLYDTTTRGLPGALQIDLGTVSTATTGVKSIAWGSPPNLNANSLYWIGVAQQGGTPPQLWCSGQSVPVGAQTSAGTSPSTGPIGAWSQPAAGAFPANASTFTAINMGTRPIAYLRKG